MRPARSSSNPGPSAGATAAAIVAAEGERDPAAGALMQLPAGGPVTFGHGAFNGAVVHISSVPGTPAGELVPTQAPPVKQTSLFMRAVCNVLKVTAILTPFVLISTASIYARLCLKSDTFGPIGENFEDLLKNLANWGIIEPNISMHEQAKLYSWLDDKLMATAKYSVLTGLIAAWLALLAVVLPNNNNLLLQALPLVVFLLNNQNLI